MEENAMAAGRILADMSDGVMTINLEGRITTFNPAAARILGVRQEDALGKGFGELFPLAEENDAFNQTILDAVYESSVSHNRIVPFNHEGQKVMLSLTTSFLQAEDEGGQRSGVIAVFSDITELQALQAAEARLTAELKDKHRELQDAYLKAEQSNEQLKAALKKVQIIRIAATAFIIILFLGIGLFVWNREPDNISPPVVGAGGTALAGASIKVMPQPVSSSITLSGKVQPLQMVTLASPLTGKVQQVLVRYGDLVSAGQTLAILDTTDAEVKLREAKAAYIKAQIAYRQMEQWNSSADVARARRSLTKAGLSLENQKKTLDETERLFKKGIIPATEYEAARQQYANQQMDFQTAEEELKATLVKGNADNQKVARFEMENADSRMKQIEKEIAAAVIKAPVSGIVMKPQAGGSSKESRAVERGVSFQQGEALFAIGDLSGLSITCKVDEIDVAKVKPGQKVLVTSDAFPGAKMDGVIQSVSSQAEEGTSGSGTSFGVRVVINTIPDELRKRIMIGMSANLEIIIYEKPDALLVPLAAVTQENGKRFVTRRKGNMTEKVEVVTGQTTQDSVEILKGLNAGDVVVVPGPSGGGSDAPSGASLRK